MEGQYDPKAWYDRGMTWTQFLAACEDNVRRMENFYAESMFSDGTLDFFKAKTPLHVLAIGEDWCPDVVQNLALVARLVDEVPRMYLRILKRDENPQLMDHYLTNGKRRIPVFAFFDEQFEELGSWRGRCRSADEWISREVTKSKTWSGMSQDELESFNREYDQRFRMHYIAETLKELQELLGP